MSRRQKGEENVRKITKIGGGSSYAVTLPIDVIRRWGWRERQKVFIEIDDERKEITIKDWSK